MSENIYIYIYEYRYIYEKTLSPFVPVNILLK